MQGCFNGFPVGVQGGSTGAPTLGGVLVQDSDGIREYQVLQGSLSGFPSCQPVEANISFDLKHSFPRHFLTLGQVGGEEGGGTRGVQPRRDGERKLILSGRWFVRINQPGVAKVFI